MLVAASGLLAIVVVAADGQPLAAPESSSTLELGPGLAAPVAVLGVVGFVAGVAVIVLGFRRQRLGKPVWRRRHTWLVWIAALLIGVFAVILLPAGPRPTTDAAAPDAADAPAARRSSRSTRRQPPPPWALLSLGGVVVVALVGAVLLGRRMRPCRGRRPSRRRPATPLAVIERVAGRAGASRTTRARRSSPPTPGCSTAFAAARPGRAPGRDARRAPPPRAGRAADPARAGRPRSPSLFLEARFSTHPIGTPTSATPPSTPSVDARDDLAGRARDRAVTA